MNIEHEQQLELEKHLAETDQFRDDRCIHCHHEKVLGAIASPGHSHYADCIWFDAAINTAWRKQNERTT